MGINISRCYICGESLADLPFTKDYVIDEYDNYGRICPECNTQLNGKIALVVENEGIKTNEAIFISRGTIKKISHHFTDNNQVYIVAPGVMKYIIEKLLELR